ncbi:hypothetical protein MHLP_03290 [Candidatus Mycoplasma haematolamae str. Purdue]|uniref:Uncharacterized protein n=1 Tax=Mycoplasma haematolamae (strain Purdue) TaxID=1212765 RepID=I7BK39_MYCHA|nr:hypothetical protein [Candidatus Mycoplasma haematolamae]AFO52238.1 hypothetical protein MHLP_03290 [Candidatus Mycoplasma haematolamae str. Purdue]
MFTFAKIVGSSLGFLTVGSTGIFVVPFSLSDHLTKEVKKRKVRLDLKNLEGRDQALKAELEKLSSTLNSGLLSVESLKGHHLSNIQKAFDFISKNEESLKSKYQELTKKVEELTKWIERESEVSSKKMKTQQTLELLKFYETILKKLNDKFREWDLTIHEIICVIQQDTDTNLDCKKKAELTSYASMLSLIKQGSHFSSSVPPPATQRKKREAKAQEAQELASVKAKEELKKVGEELEKISQSLETTWKNFLTNRGKILDERQHFTTYQSFLDLAAAFVEDEKVSLRGKIREITKDSESLVEKINDLTAFIVKSSKVIEDLKVYYSILKRHEGKVTASLCSLPTITKEDCFVSEPNLESL